MNRLITEKAPPGATCTEDLDPSLREASPCGKPAVVSWRWVGADASSGADGGWEEIPLYLCDECRVARLQARAQADQDDAFEEEFGWPPRRNLIDLVVMAGRMEIHRQKMVENNAPEVIRESQNRLVSRRTGWIRAWLKNHTPQHGSQVASVKSLIESAKEMDGVPEAVFKGLELALEIAFEIDAES